MLANAQGPQGIRSKPVHGIVILDCLEQTNPSAGDETEGEEGESGGAHNLVMETDREGMLVDGPRPADEVGADDDDEEKQVHTKGNVGRMLPFFADGTLLRGLADVM